MGAIGGLLGVNGGVNGTGFNMTQPVTGQQVNQSTQGTQALLQALQNQQGLQNQSNVYNQFQNVAAGQGPNPAQAMLNQATGQNIANQAALMAGQRGAAQNVGLIARQAAQQGASTQQQAAGQAATMQANQSLGALGQAGNMANTMAGNQVNAQLTNQQQLLNALQGYNTQQAGLANTTMQGQQALVGGGANAAGAASGLIGGSSGLTALMAAEGGQISSAGPKSILGRHLSMASGGEVPAKVSPGEAFVNPENVKAVAEGKMSPLKAGEIFPGKAKVPGDSLKNDVVKRNLPEGGIVIPRTKVNSSDPVRTSADFVRSVLAKKGMK